MIDHTPPQAFMMHEWLTYLWVLVLATLGGTVSFIRKVKQGHARAWNFTEFIGEIFVAAFAGLITFFLCDWSGVDPRLTAALIGISGHMGSRAIFHFENYLTSRFPVPEVPEDDK